jgi:hypothetical protein
MSITRIERMKSGDIVAWNKGKTGIKQSIETVAKRVAKTKGQKRTIEQNNKLSLSLSNSEAFKKANAAKAKNASNAAAIVNSGTFWFTNGTVSFRAKECNDQTFRRGRHSSRKY